MRGREDKRVSRVSVSTREEAVQFWFGRKRASEASEAAYIYIYIQGGVIFSAWFESFENF